MSPPPGLCGLLGSCVLSRSRGRSLSGALGLSRRSWVLTPNAHLGRSGMSLCKELAPYKFRNPVGNKVYFPSESHWKAARRVGSQHLPRNTRWPSPPSAQGKWQVLERRDGRTDRDALVNSSLVKQHRGRRSGGQSLGGRAGGLQGGPGPAVLFGWGGLLARKRAGKGVSVSAHMASEWSSRGGCEVTKSHWSPCCASSSCVTSNNSPNVSILSFSICQMETVPPCEDCTCLAGSKCSVNAGNRHSAKLACGGSTQLFLGRCSQSLGDVKALR